jgi:ABC-type proline/glycine betaine transport system permease subunit
VLTRRWRRSALREPVVSLDPVNLPQYALRTTLRMMAAMIVSLVFTFTYGTLAAKSRRAELVLVPLLDILQSVPVLGYISFTVVFFMSLFPPCRGRRSCGDLRHFHEPSLEHDLQLSALDVLTAETIRTDLLDL